MKTDSIEASDWLLERFNQSEKAVSGAITYNKTDHTMLEGAKYYVRKQCQELFTFLFAATMAFGKMCDCILLRHFHN